MKFTKLNLGDPLKQNPTVTVAPSFNRNSYARRMRDALEQASVDTNLVVDSRCEGGELSHLDVISGASGIVVSFKPTRGGEYRVEIFKDNGETAIATFYTDDGGIVGGTTGFEDAVDSALRHLKSLLSQPESVAEEAVA